MRILVANDDGINAKGLHTLVAELSREHEVVVVAPNVQKSAASHGFTYANPVRVENAALPDLPHVPAYAVHGTPADCVRLGVTTLFEDIEMVVTGINHGSNTGTDVLYSGTVGSAMEACLMGIPAIAVSNYAGKPVDFSGCAKAACMAVTYVQSNPLKRGTLLNINAPDGSFESFKGIRKGSVCMLNYNERYDKVTSPYGHDYYLRHVTNFTTSPDAIETDDHLVNQGYAVLTPLHYDLTDYQSLDNVDIDVFSGQV